jgi:hypothetical protein
MSRMITEGTLGYSDDKDKLKAREEVGSPTGCSCTVAGLSVSDMEPGLHWSKKEGESVVIKN